MAADLLQNDFDIQADINEEIDSDNSIRNAYTDVYQHIPDKKSESGGYVKITFLENDKESDWKADVLEQLPHEIEALQDQGFSLKDIAIVVRQNHEAVLVAETLIAYQENNPDSKYRFDLISNEALIIGSVQSIRTIISLMRYFRNPNDSTNRMLAIYEYYMFVQKCTPSEALHSYIGDDNNLSSDFPKELKQQFANLSSMPFYDMIEGFFALSADALDNKENAYVQAFLDIALKFSSERSADLNAFLEWWDEEGCKKALFSPDDQDAIRLITVHKSKGLGFGAVIMPFVNWRVDHNPRHNNIVWCKPNVAPFNSLGVAPLKYGSKLAETIFKEAYLEEKRYTYIDNINLLYVAFTRAKHRLIIFAPKPTKTDKITDVSDILWRSVSENEDKMVYQYGEPSKREASKEAKVVNTYKTEKWSSVPYENRLKLRLNSIGFFTDDGSRDYGNMMHDIVSNIKTLSDIPNAVEMKISEGEINEADREKTIDELTSYLSIPGASNWYNGKYRVLNETQLLHPNIGFSRPDRVMIDNNEVVVVDYKFGEVENPRYLQQVRRYAKSITEMGYPNVKGAVFYVKSGKIVEI